MRKLAYLKAPYKCNKNDTVYKIMVYQKKRAGVLLFYYCDYDAVLCSYDAYYDDLKDVYEEWNDEIDERGWIDIGDPLPDCEPAALIPIHVKDKKP